MTDALGVLELTEVWVQNFEGYREAVTANVLVSDAVNNQTLSDRWRKLYELAVQSWPRGLIGCGYERKNPPPTLIDTSSMAPVNFDGWRLCAEDDVLRAAGLPPFSSTLYRYLVQGREGEAKFIPLSADCPRTQRTVELATAVPAAARAVPLNPAAGLILIKPAETMRLGELSELLAGKPYEGAAYGRSRLRVGPAHALSSPSRGFMFPSVDGPPSAAALVERYLLRVAVFSSMIEDVARFTTATQRPLLNLQLSSFAARVEETGTSLPALWTARASLMDAGDAVPVEFPQGDTAYRYCLPGKSVRTSIYQPALASRGSVEGLAQLYISGSTQQEHGRVFDGTLTLIDPIRPTGRDVFRIRIPTVNGRRVDLYAKVDPGTSPAAGVLKFRSVPDARIKSDEPAIDELKGVPLQEVAFEFYPLLSSACDVYSLAVLGTDLLLTRPGGNNAEQFSDLRNLAARCREIHSSSPLPARIATIFDERPAEWAARLGPQHLLTHPLGLDPQRAIQFITPELWWPTLALLVRMIPGQGPDSYLADLGDALRGRPEGIYGELLKETRELAGKARSLLVGEWGTNREVGLILDELRRAQSMPNAASATAPPRSTASASGATSHPGRVPEGKRFSQVAVDRKS